MLSTLIVQLSGCTIEKRRYTGGFHVEHIGKKQSIVSSQQKDSAAVQFQEAIIEKGTELITQQIPVELDSVMKVGLKETPHQVIPKQKVRIRVGTIQSSTVAENVVVSDIAPGKSSSMHPDALGSFLCGLGSFACLFAIIITSLSPLWLFITLLALMILLAFAASRKANRAFKDMHYARDRYSGKALAAAGLVMGVLSIVAFIGLILIAVLGLAFSAFT